MDVMINIIINTKERENETARQFKHNPTTDSQRADDLHCRQRFSMKQLFTKAAVKSVEGIYLKELIETLLSNTD